MRPWMIGATLAMLACSTHCRAEPTPLPSDFGAWHAVQARSLDGLPLCAAAASSTTAPVRRVLLHWAPGNSSITLSVFKETWRVSDGSPVPLAISFDSGEALPLHGDGSGMSVSAFLPESPRDKLLAGMTSSNTMLISFPNGKEPTWRVALKDSVIALRGMRDCIAKYPDTQPN